MQNKRKIGFTLAEALITLAIIGVVASITIPSIIKNYEKHQTEVKLKKAFVTLNEAFNMARKDYGDPIGWDWSEGWHNCVWGGFIPVKIFKFIKPHLKIQKDYMGTRNCGGSHVFVAKTISGDNVNMEHQYLLQDGTALSFNTGGYSWSTDPWLYIIVDINGDKGPNIVGKDIFNFYYFAKEGFTSNGGLGRSSSITRYIRQNGRNAAIDSCKTSRFSTYCTDLIMSNNWKIPDDYPW